MIGRRLLHYEIVERLGAGGMGEVYRARDTRLGRDVALKVLAPEVAGSPEALDRFRVEARTVAVLNHPNIVTLFSVEEADGVHFLTMELVEGKTLEDCIPAGGMDVDRFLAIAVDLTDALATAHRKGVVHRDVKPGNIMVGDDGRVRVLDFGLAKLREPKPGTTDTRAPTRLLTAPGRVVGTVPYMSPEQLLGRLVDDRSDQFSLCATLYQMITGHGPFESESDAGLVSAILRDQPRPVGDSNPEAPRRLEAILQKGLAKSPDDRYRSVEELGEALRELRRERSERDGASGTRLNKPIVGLVVVGILIVAAIAIESYLGRRPAVPREGDFAVAVMPFADLTGSELTQHLGDGIAVSLITRLSELSGLRVVGRSEAWSRFAAGLGASRLGKSLSVDFLIEGEVQRQEDVVRVTTRLADTHTNAVAWSGEFEGRAADPFDLQRRIAERLIEVLRIPLSSTERSRLERAPTRSIPAFDAYLKGQRELERIADPRSARLATRHFRDAVEIDSEFALAHAGLSGALVRRYREDHDVGDIEAAERSARRAIEIDPDLPAARVALASVLRARGQISESIAEVRSVLEDHPKPDEAYREMAYAYRQAGDYDAAEDCLRAAVHLGGEHWYHWNALGAFLLRFGELADAREAFRKAESLAPADVTWPRENLAVVTIFEGNYEAAVEIFDRIDTPTPDPMLLANIGTAYFYTRRLEEAEEYYRLAVQLEPDDASHLRNLGDLYVRMGREADASEQYRLALDRIEQAVLDAPGDRELSFRRVVITAKAGECDRAVSIARDLETRGALDPYELHDVAQAYALCDLPSDALRALRESIAREPSDLICDEDEFAELRSHPDFPIACP